jgi:serine protein kinase
MEGISPRAYQDKISNAGQLQDGYISHSSVLNELEDGLKNHSLINSEEDRRLDLLSVVKEEYTEIVRTRFSARSRPTKRRSSGYAAAISIILRPIPNEKVRNKYTGQ